MSRLIGTPRNIERFLSVILQVCDEQDRYRTFSKTNFSTADIPELRPVLQNYLACGSKEIESADFFGLNVYEWCGKSSYKGSGYAELQKNASDYNIPLFVSETGCRIPKPRTFDDQAAILGPEMADTWSGTIVYEWISEENDYGLISYGRPQLVATPGRSY